MMRIWNWIKSNPNRAMFLVPIILVAFISISHVVTWYDMANPINWAIYLSVAIEVAAMTALVAASKKVKGGVWFMFGIVTFIQVLGNVFYCYKEIDENGDLFKSWVELTTPVWELMGTTETVGLKRWLAFLEGGLLPLISLTSLHFFVKYNNREEEEVVDKEEYFKSRNRHMEDLVEKRRSADNFKKGEMTKFQGPGIEVKEKDDIELSVPEGKEFNTPYPIIEIVDDQEELEKQLDESISDMINDIEKEKVDEENEIIEPPKEVKPVEETKKEVINKKIVKQPPKPPKTKINRID